MIARRFVRWAVCLSLIASAPGCGGKKDGDAKGASENAEDPGAGEPASPEPGPTDPELRVGSSSFYVELAGVYERYRDPGTAAANFRKAIEAASGPQQRIRAYAGLARVEEARGNRAAAIEALEEALEAATTAPGSTGDVPEEVVHESGDTTELVTRLGRLYIAAGQAKKADALFRRALVDVREPWSRRQLLAHLVSAQRAGGTLQAEVGEAEEKLDESTEPDEELLWYLAAAYGDGHGAAEMPSDPSATGDREDPAVDPTRQIAVYEKLARLHPRDPDVQQRLIRAYERAGKLAAAADLIREPVAEHEEPPSGEPDSNSNGCEPGMLGEGPHHPEVSAARRIIRMYQRAGDAEKAAAETASLVRLGQKPAIGLAAYLAGAQLYAEQGENELAKKTLAQADRAARTAQDRRRVSMARAELLLKDGDRAEAEKLYDRWKRSDDPCLQAEATRRLAMKGTGEVPRAE